MSLLNFLGPRFDSEGNPTGPQEYENIVKERYLISKRTNTSYTDIGDISVLERRLLMNFIAEEIEQEKKFIEEEKTKSKNRTK